MWPATRMVSAPRIIQKVAPTLAPFALSSTKANRSSVLTRNHTIRIFTTSARCSLSCSTALSALIGKFNGKKPDEHTHVARVCSYFTPAKSAGFAPHYDDIDAFIIQCEGRKKWTIHAPDADSQWPPTSSENFTPQQMESMADRRVWSGWLEEGDMLYLPRGYIHSARTGKGHSLHVTISVAQEFSYRHLLKEVVKLLLDAKADSIPRLRSNLPINPLDICGVADTLYENEDQYGKT